MQVSVTVGLEVSWYWIEAVYQVLRNEMCVLEGSWQDGCETKQDPVGLLGTEAFLCPLLLACR